MSGMAVRQWSVVNDSLLLIGSPMPFVQRAIFKLELINWQRTKFSEFWKSHHSRQVQQLVRCPCEAAGLAGAAAPHGERDFGRAPPDVRFSVGQASQWLRTRREVQSIGWSARWIGWAATLTPQPCPCLRNLPCCPKWEWNQRRPGAPEFYFPRPVPLPSLAPA